MRALIVTDIIDEYFKQDSILDISAFNTVKTINKLLTQFEFVVFLINKSNYVFETKVHKSIELQNCKQDFYIYKKKSDKDYVFKNKEFQKLFKEKDINEFYIAGFDLAGEIKNIALKSRSLNNKTIVIDDASYLLCEKDINETMKSFAENDVYFLESFELEEFQKK